MGAKLWEFKVQGIPGGTLDLVAKWHALLHVVARSLAGSSQKHMSFESGSLLKSDLGCGVYFAGAHLPNTFKLALEMPTQFVLQELSVEPNPSPAYQLQARTNCSGPLG